MAKKKEMIWNMSEEAQFNCALILSLAMGLGSARFESVEPQTVLKSKLKRNRTWPQNHLNRNRLNMWVCRFGSWTQSGTQTTWMLKCRKVLNMWEIWLMILHTLRGQYEAITGEHEVVIRKQQQFREFWTKAEVFTSFGERIKWRYAPPSWLFWAPSWTTLQKGFWYLTCWLMWVWGV